VKLHASGPTRYNVITGYGEDHVLVNGRRYQSSLVVLPDRILDWSVSAFTDLSAEDFKILEDLKVEIVLLGTGPKQRFPHPRLTSALTAARIGLEVMDLKAACRTFNILVAEERKVAAALMLK
jgi:uncharacterized protein